MAKLNIKVAFTLTVYSCVFCTPPGFLDLFVESKNANLHFPFMHEFSTLLCIFKGHTCLVYGKQGKVFENATQCSKFIRKRDMVTQFKIESFLRVLYYRDYLRVNSIYKTDQV